MENEAQAEAARQEAERAAKLEKIAPREKHEAAVLQVVDKLRAEGFFRDGEDATVSFPDAETIAEWLVRNELPKNAGKAVAKCDSTCLTNPAVKRDLTDPDPLMSALVAQGYHVEACPNFEAMTEELDAMTHLIYEKKTKEGGGE